MTVQPLALVIEDRPADQMIAEAVLGDHGFDVWCFDELLRGLHAAEQALQRTTPVRPILILTDVMLPTATCPMLQSTLLLASLSEQIETGLLHPAHLIAITAVPTPQREAEVLAAGAHALWPKPLQYPTDGIRLAALVQTPPPIASSAQASLAHTLNRQAVRSTALQALQLLRSDASQIERQRYAPAVTWDDEAVKQLILEPLTLLEREPYRKWLMIQGDMERVYDALRHALHQHGSTRHLVPLLNALIHHPCDSQRVMVILHKEKSQFYEERKQLFQSIRALLNGPIPLLWNARHSSQVPSPEASM